MRKQRTRKLLDLPRSTAQCETGPIIEQSPGLLRVRYDSLVDSDFTWTAVTFSGVVAMQFTTEAAASERFVGAYSQICVIENSEWIDVLRATAAPRHQQIPLSKRHFVIFFDHHGGLDVVADSYDVLEDVGGPDLGPGGGVGHVA